MSEGAGGLSAEDRLVGANQNKVESEKEGTARNDIVDLEANQRRHARTHARGGSRALR